MALLADNAPVSTGQGGSHSLLTKLGSPDRATPRAFQGKENNSNTPTGLWGLSFVCLFI